MKRWGESRGRRGGREIGKRKGRREREEEYGEYRDERRKRGSMGARNRSVHQTVVYRHAQVSCYSVFYHSGGDILVHMNQLMLRVRNTGKRPFSVHIRKI